MKKKLTLKKVTIRDLDESKLNQMAGGTDTVDPADTCTPTCQYTCGQGGTCSPTCHNTCPFTCGNTCGCTSGCTAGYTCAGCRCSDQCVSLDCPITYAQGCFC